MLSATRLNALIGKLLVRIYHCDAEQESTPRGRERGNRFINELEQTSAF